MRLVLRGGSAILVAIAALAIGTWLLWAAGTDAMVLYLVDAAPRDEASNAQTLRKLAWARARFPNDDRVLRALAQAHLNESTRRDRQAHTAAAMEALEAATRAAPFDARLDYALAWLHLEADDLIEAERAFLGALDKDPVNAEYRYGLGRLREAQGRVDLAIGQYESALDLTNLPKAAARLDLLQQRQESNAP